MNLTEEPVAICWPTTHYVFIEKIGPFLQTAPQAWQELHNLLPQLAEHYQIKGYLSLYKTPDTYRAGVSLAEKPEALPTGLTYAEFLGGPYLRFTLTGSYMHLPAASGRVWQIAAERNLPLREGFAIENYTTDPRTTPVDNLVTEILLPTL